MNTIKKYILASLVAVAALSSCDDKLDITPKGQSTLSKVADLEMLLNNNMSLGYPTDDLGLVCNEGYGQLTNVPTTLASTNTVTYALTAWDESVDRAMLTLSDERYTSTYRYINYMNTIIDKAPEAEGDSERRQQIVAEAHVMRAYLHWLLVNIYARQYDASTAQTDGGIAYVSDLNLTETKEKETVAQVYEKILADCADEYIAQLPVKSQDVLRGGQAWGNAVRAKVLMQMKRYEEALPYARRAVELGAPVENRMAILTDKDWVQNRQDDTNLIYAGATLFGCVISPETAARFERGDLVKDYAFMNGQEEMGGGDDDDDEDDWDDDEEYWGEDDAKVWGEQNAKTMVMIKAARKKASAAKKHMPAVTDADDEGWDDEGWDDEDEDLYTPANAANPAWSPMYGMLLSGVMGSNLYFSMRAWSNGYGITADRMRYVLAELLIRTGRISEGMQVINEVRQYRIHPDYYEAWDADSEADAMALLQQAKWTECIGSYENFFDMKRWNSEDAYKQTLSRMIMTMSGDIHMFTLAPDSKLWIMPFPQNATRMNPTLTQNY